jgi:hypothetical protein
MNVATYNADFYKLKLGDKVKLTDGSVCEFVRHKQKNFVGLINGQTYNISNTMFVSLVEKGTQNTEWYKELKKGDPFYIVKGGKDCVAFRFDRMQLGKIVGKHFVTGQDVIIDTTFIGGKI